MLTRIGKTVRLEITRKLVIIASYGAGTWSSQDKSDGTMKHANSLLQLLKVELNVSEADADAFIEANLDLPKVVGNAEALTKLLARQTGRMFFSEFEEALNPAKTDWDAVAWSDDSSTVSRMFPNADLETLSSLYAKTLVKTTKELAE